MGVDTKFYTQVDVTDFTEVKSILEKEFNTPVRIEVDENRGNSYARFFFTYQSEQRTLWVHRNTLDFDTKKNHTLFDLGYWGASELIMRKIAPYFGGWLDVNDCDDKPDEYIEKRVDPKLVTNEEKLYSLIAKVYGYNEAGNLISFIKNNKNEIQSLNFGINA